MSLLELVVVFGIQAELVRIEQRGAIALAPGAVLPQGHCVLTAVVFVYLVPLRAHTWYLRLNQR